MKTSIVYMVAGMASRFGGDIKQLAKVGPNQETLIELSIQQAIRAGFDEIIFIVGPKTQKPFLEVYGEKYNGVSIKYTFQGFDSSYRDKPRGTTDALLTIKKSIDCPFVVCNGDDLYGTQAFEILYNHLQSSHEPATVGYKLIDTLPIVGTVNRGIFQTHNDKVTNLIENFDISISNLEEKGLKSDFLCSMNIFGLQPKHLDLLEENLIKFKQTNKGNRKIECILPTEINTLIQQNLINLQIYITNQKRYGITNPEDEQSIRNSLINYKL